MPFNFFKKKNLIGVHSFVLNFLMILLLLLQEKEFKERHTMRALRRCSQEAERGVLEESPGVVCTLG